MTELKHEIYDAPELLGELLIFEVNPEYCRETVTVTAPEANILMGSLLVKNADGTFSPWEAGDTDAAAIALRDVPAANGEDALVPVVRRSAMLSAAMLKWPAEAADEQKAAALDALEAVGIIVR